jgi:hypothetical protein
MKSGSRAESAALQGSITYNDQRLFPQLNIRPDGKKLHHSVSRRIIVATHGDWFVSGVGSSYRAEVSIMPAKDAKQSCPLLVLILCSIGVRRRSR